VPAGAVITRTDTAWLPADQWHGEGVRGKVLCSLAGTGAIRRQNAAVAVALHGDLGITRLAREPDLRLSGREGQVPPIDAFLGARGHMKNPGRPRGLDLAAGGELPLGLPAIADLDRCRCLGICSADGGARGESLIEAACELGRNLVEDRLRGGDHRGHAGGEKSLDLPLGGTAVEKGQLEAMLLPEEPGEAAGMGARDLAFWRFQEERAAVRVTSEVKDRDPVAVERVLKEVQHLLTGGVRAFHDFAEPAPHRRCHRRAHPAQFLRQVSQIERRVHPVVGEGEEQYDWLGSEAHRVIGVCVSRQPGDSEK
jgi:hypothetical protein